MAITTVEIHVKLSTITILPLCKIVLYHFHIAISPQLNDGLLVLFYVVVPLSHTVILAAWNLPFVPLYLLERPDPLHISALDTLALLPIKRLDSWLLCTICTLKTNSTTHLSTIDRTIPHMLLKIRSIPYQCTRDQKHCLSAH